MEEKNLLILIGIMTVILWGFVFYVNTSGVFDYLADPRGALHNFLSSYLFAPMTVAFLLFIYEFSTKDKF